jgi:predicted PurR-regulated permease PerM
MSNAKRFVIDDPSSLKWIQYIVYGSIVLYFGKNIFIPISFALLISFVLYPVCAWLERKGVGRLTAIIMSIAMLLVVGLLLVGLLVYQFMGFVHEWPAIETKVTTAVADMVDWIEMLGVSREAQSELLTKMSSQSGGNVLSLIKNTLAASASSVVLLILIPV